MDAIEQITDDYITKTLSALDGLHTLIESFDEIFFIAVCFSARPLSPFVGDRYKGLPA